jgi:uncharacterized membrane protein (DUF485 family)
VGNLANDQLSNQQEKQNQQKFNFESIAKDEGFVQLLTAKKRFLIPSTIIFLFLYFLLPVLTSYSTVLNNPAISSISWTWVYSVGLFIMTWVLCTLYARKALKFDQMAEDLIEKYENEGDQSH